MASPVSASAAGAAPVAVVLDAEKLDVYPRRGLGAGGRKLISAEHRILRDQVERASVSVNISEGAGRRSGKGKQRHCAIARGSAMEVAAALDLVAARRLAPEADTRSTRQLYVRVVQMLNKLDTALA